ncbi:ATP-binding protein [Bosea sp. ANAM02]|uniref:ATP-binding protein n=1 Tax=Bosea sp. ANAM02 TaxID=2020412 RepID=UPI001565385A|nr:ATP-binding protein [Bosea sp. ANAM02]
MTGSASVRFSPFRPRTMALLALAASVPLVLLASFAGVLILRQQQEEMQETAREATFNLADTLQREFDAQINVLKVMAASRAFDNGLDLYEFRDLAERSLTTQPNFTAITLNDLTGVRVARVPEDSHIGEQAKDILSHELTVATQQPSVGNVTQFPEEGPVFAVRVPIVRDSKIKGVISTTLKPSVLVALLQASRLSPEWISLVIDGNDRIVARAGDQGDFASQPGSLASEPARKARHTSDAGVYAGRTLDGRATNAHYRMLPGLRWSVHVAIPDKIYQEPVRRSIFLAVTAGIVALAISGVFVTLLLRELRRGQEVGRKVEDGLRLEALGRVTGGVAHDFNNLLMIMMGGADILKSRSGDSTRVQMIADTIASAAQRGRQLTTHLLAFARRSSHDPISFRIQDRIAHLAVMIERAINPDVRLQISIDPNTPAILADPNAFEVALINLAVNASDAMPDGGILTIRAHAWNTFRSPNSVSISVTDTGAGISQEFQEKIFEPFFTTKPTGKGTGLGLSQVHGFAYQSGGDIHVRSEMGQGSTFTLVMPRSNAPPVPSPLPIVSNDEVEGGRLLIIEDHVEVGSITGEVLRASGFKVKLVESAEEALDVIETDKAFDAVLSDIVLGDGMSGLDAAPRIQSALPNAAVVMMTGYSEALARGATCGFPLVRKPFDQAEVVRVIQSAIAQGPNREAA